MKSNYVKSLVLSLWIAVLFTGFNSNAAWVRPNPSNFCKDWFFPNCSDYPYSMNIWFTSVSSNYDDFNELNYLVCNRKSTSSLYDSWYPTVPGRYYSINKPNNLPDCSFISWNIKTFNDWDYLTWRWQNCPGTACYRYSYFQYNFINQTYDWSAPIFSWWYDLWKKYNSVNYAYLPALPDINGTGDNYYFTQPWHGSWIFYNYLYDIDLKTIQYIWNQVLYDKFIYVDSLAQNDNIWLVDTATNEAWSMTESDINILSDFLFWNFTFSDDLLNNAGWSDYYKITLNTWWSSFLPQTYWNFSYSSFNDLIVWSKSFLGSNIWISYNKVYDFVAPSYWSWNESNTNNISSQVLEDYKKCINEYQSLQDIVNYSVQCIKVENQYSWSYYYDSYLDYVINLDYYKENDLSYTGVIKSAMCKSFMNAAENYYDALNNSWLYHDHIFEIESYIWLWGDIDINQKCWVYPGTNLYDDFEISRSCKWFWVGCWYTWNNMLWFVYNSTKWYFGTFFEESFWEIKTSYNKWVDYFGDYSCENVYWKSYSWWNFLLLFVSAWLVFSFVIIL